MPVPCFLEASGYVGVLCQMPFVDIAQCRRSRGPTWAEWRSTGCGALFGSCGDHLLGMPRSGPWYSTAPWVVGGHPGFGLWRGLRGELGLGPPGVL